MRARSVSYIAAVILGTQCLAADAGKDLTPKSLEGTWAYASMTTDGRPVLDQSFVHYRWVFQGDRVTVFFAEREVIQLRYEIDSSTTPARFDAWYVGSDESLKEQYSGRIKGILRVSDGDTLIRCYGTPGGDRPTKFESSQGSNAVLLVTRRSRAK